MKISPYARLKRMQIGPSRRRYPAGLLLLATVAGWVFLSAAEVVLILGVLPLLAMVMSRDLLPSLKIVLDMAALGSAGWVTGRIARPNVFAAATLLFVGLACVDLTPYLLLNVPWLLRLTLNTLQDTRFLNSWFSTFAMHVLLIGSVFAGANLSRPRQPPLGIGIG